MRTRFSIAIVLCASLFGVGASSAPASGGSGPVISEFGTGLSAGVGLWGIAPGPDGNLWFTEETLGGVGRVTPAAVITEFLAGFPTGSPRGIVTGPDGNLWVAMAGGNGAIAKVTKTGVVTEFPVPTVGDPNDIAVGPDNNLWYVDPAADVVGRITPTGSITEFTAGLTNASAPSYITRGPDGALWFTETDAGRIGRITTAGVITEYSSGISGSSKPADIAAGPDGNLWFTENADPGAIGRITPNGDITEFTTGLTTNSHPAGHRRRAGRQPLVHGVQVARPDRPDHDRRRYHRVFHRSVRDRPSLGHRGRPRREHVVHREQQPGSRRPDHAPAARARHGRRHRSQPPPPACAASSAPTRRPPSTSFEWGRTTGYGNETPTTYAGSSYDLNAVMATIDGLEPGTTYHYRLVAENDAGETKGPDRVFATESLPAETSSDPVEAPVVPDFGEDRRGRARGHGAREGAGRRLGDDGAGRRDAALRDLRHAPRRGVAH